MKLGNRHQIMKTKHLLSSFLCAGLLAVTLVACESEQAEQARLSQKAKISRADAEKTALARVPNGTVKEGELEEEKGRLIWSFDIATPGTKNVTEININAVTGEFVSQEIETPEQQAKEKKDKD
jgi:uncharacterized membrane protein YkoI